MNTITVSTNEYPSSVQTDMLSFYWKFHTQQTGIIQGDDIIEMAIVAKTRGWLSIGLDFNKTGMNQADCFIGFFDQENNLPILYDDWMPGKSIPKNDSIFGGTNDILQVTGSFVNGVTTLKFIRKVDTGDVLADKPIRNATVGISWAINSNSIDVTKVHSSYGQFNINLMTHVGILNLIKQPLIQFHLIATGSVALLMTLAGMSYVFISRKEKNFFISLVFHTKFSNLIRNEFIGSWLNPILELTIGEITLIIIHLMLTSVWFCFGYFNNSSPILSKIGKAFGYASVITLTTTILPITRYSAFVFIFGISFERAIKYHKWCSLLTLLVTTLHGIFMAIPMGMKGNLERLVSVRANGYILFGTIAWIAMVIMSLFSIEIIRRKCWELFKVVHVILAPVVLVFSSIHARGWERTLPVLGVAIGLLLVDYLLRFVFGYVLPTKVVKMEYDEKCQVTKIVFEKSNLGMWSTESLGMAKFVHVCIPGVSLFQSHPLTISSYEKLPQSVEFTCHVKNNGKGWSKDVADFAVKRKCCASSIFARVEGPYGKLSLDVNSYSNVVLIAGGIGVTPINAIFEELTNNSKHALQKNIFVIWTMKDENLMTMFPSLLERYSNVKQSFYVTSSASNSLKINSSDAYNNRVHYNSRPNFVEYLTLISETVGCFDNSAAIIVCGPNQMNIDVYNASRKVAKESGVHFHIHRETFEM
ncbi:predicted protein [Naegleria gruberi]|uniref:Predicted protein n=1 Tax=Naegleria gruberi TaxID=5762 RepID=D2V965_NAEGR|nr:uncharacterized protein NAEGRDRAFT_47775 [Naegleria gruberi]EFC46657.1 predicted protein [Naegleria gruberi]|eukprot:XP_002679401.1 predicted protein [Naegleria gruberi strain NEG-M]